MIASSARTEHHRLLAAAAIAALRKRQRATGVRDPARNAALKAVAFYMSGAVLLYATEIALARWLGTSGFGVYAVVWAVVLVLGGISSLGLGGVIATLSPGGQHNGLFHGSRIVAMAAGTLLAVIGLAGLWLFEPLVARPYVVPAYLALICIPMYAVTEVQDGMLRSSFWHGAGMLPSYALRPLLMLLAMAAAHASGWPVTATTAMGAAIVATWLTGVVQQCALERRQAPEASCARLGHDIGGWLRSALPLTAATGASVVLNSADILVLSLSMAPGDIAVYVAAAKTMGLLLLVQWAAGTWFAGRLDTAAPSGDTRRLEQAVAETVAWAFWPSLAAAAVILALGLPLLNLFGPDFVAGYPIMFVLGLGFMARAAVGPVAMILHALGQHRVSAGIAAASALLNVLLLVTLVPKFGLLGAATATALALATEACLHWLAARVWLGIDVGIWQNAARAFSAKVGPGLA